MPAPPAAGQEHRAAAAEAKDVGNAFGKGQHTQELQRIRVVERNLFLPGHRYQRRPRTGGQSRRRARPRSVDHRLLEQPFRHRGWTGRLARHTAAHQSRVLFLGNRDLRAGVFRRPLLNPLADQVNLGLGQLVLHRRHFRLLFVADQRVQARVFHVPRQNHFAAGAAGHHLGVGIERQAAFVPLLRMAGEAMLLENRPDVVVVRDLCGRGLSQGGRKAAGEQVDNGN